MNEITVHKADPIAQEAVVGVAIHVDKPFPTGLTPQETADLFHADAQAVADVLWGSLPGGTQSALIEILLRRRASQFRVRFPAVEDAG